jgi:hypothetical protein
VIDYSEVGGPVGSLNETKAFLGQGMSNFTAFQHLSTTSEIVIDGNTARARTILFNPMVMNHEGAERVFFIGLWYRDELVRTPQGWRIQHRREQKSWAYNQPDGMLP